MKAVRSLFLDAAMFLGLGCFLYGVHMVYEPAAYIVGGLMVTLMTLSVARHVG